MTGPSGYANRNRSATAEHIYVTSSKLQDMHIFCDICFRYWDGAFGPDLISLVLNIMTRTFLFREVLTATAAVVCPRAFVSVSSPHGWSTLVYCQFIPLMTCEASTRWER